VRIFTPAREIAFAGHPILGTAWVVREHIARGGAAVTLDLPVGPVTVDFEPSGAGRDVAWFRAPPVTPGARLAPEAIAAAVGLTAQDIDERAPAQQMGAGTAALIVPVRDARALQRARLDLQAFAPLAGAGFAPLVYLFCLEPRHPANHVRARFFFEAFGVREDPATGNGAAFLGRYLLEHPLLPGAELSLRIEQGEDVHRPSLVQLRARRTGATFDIRVGGHVLPVARGELL
jgi:trans-2,3-dihydro-3-hydroxyanthranilate isomerase